METKKLKGRDNIQSFSKSHQVIKVRVRMRKSDGSIDEYGKWETGYLRT